MQAFLTLDSALIPLDMRESFCLSTNSTSTPTGLDQDVLFKSLKAVDGPGHVTGIQLTPTGLTWKFTEDSGIKSFPEYVSHRSEGTVFAPKVLRVMLHIK